MRGRLEGLSSLTETTNAVESIVRSNPELSLLTGIGILATGILLVALLRWFRRPMGVRLKNALQTPADIAVLMHPNPDPDAMACAIGVAHIAEYCGTPATICYSGQIRHQENRAFRTVLDLDFVQVDDVQDIIESEIVLVDHNRARGFNGAELIEPYAVIDHHPGDGHGISFTDVRPEYGSCASIVAEYFDELNASIFPANGGENGNGFELENFSEELILTTEVATGLLYGIQADTSHLTKGCTAADFKACSFLYPATDESLLDRIANPQVSTEVLEIKARAISNRTVRGPFAISDVGEITDADAIPQAAEELMALEGITAVVVFGRVNDMIHVSGRSRDDRVHMGRTLETVLESVPMASAGGHARMGGGQVIAEYFAGIGPSGISQSNISEDLRNRLFDALAGNI